MTVTIHSRKELEALLAKEALTKAAVISFYDPVGSTRIRSAAYAPIAFGDRCDRVMSIALYDLDPEALSRVGLTVEDYFPEADALADFVFQAIREGRDLICQCEYGQSRSAACAAAIRQFLWKDGIEVFADYRYYPNQLVYHKVFDALERRRST